MHNSSKKLVWWVVDIVIRWYKSCFV